MANQARLGRKGGQSRRTLTVALAWPVLLALPGCGGEEAGPKPQMAAPSSDSPAAGAAAGATDERYILLGSNPKWKPIAPLFEDYAKREIHGISSSTLPNLVQFVERPIIEAPAAVGTDPTAEPGVATDTEPLNCEKTGLTSQPLDRFQLIILQTGIAQPKAAVVEPGGDRYDVVVGDAIGSECGRVKAILQYRMLVSIPGKPQAVVLSIAPPLNELEDAAKEQGADL